MPRRDSSLRRFCLCRMLGCRTGPSRLACSTSGAHLVRGHPAAKGRGWCERGASAFAYARTDLASHFTCPRGSRSLVCRRRQGQHYIFVFRVFINGRKCFPTSCVSELRRPCSRSSQRRCKRLPAWGSREVLRISMAPICSHLQKCVPFLFILHCVFDVSLTRYGNKWEIPVR